VLALLKNTYKLESSQLEKVPIYAAEGVEETLIVSSFTDSSEQNLARAFLEKLYAQKQDGEVQKDFEERIILEAKHVFNQ
jgi:hypothetical protein